MGDWGGHVAHVALHTRRRTAPSVLSPDDNNRVSRPASPCFVLCPHSPSQRPQAWTPDALRGPSSSHRPGFRDWRPPQKTAAASAAGPRQPPRARGARHTPDIVAHRADTRPLVNMNVLFISRLPAVELAPLDPRRRRRRPTHAVRPVGLCQRSGNAPCVQRRGRVPCPHRLSLPLRVASVFPFAWGAM